MNGADATENRIPEFLATFNLVKKDYPRSSVEFWLDVVARRLTNNGNFVFISSKDVRNVLKGYI